MIRRDMIQIQVGGTCSDCNRSLARATRVQITGEVVDAAENGSGYGGDISRDTYRAIIEAAFRAAGFGVEP